MKLFKTITLVCMFWTLGIIGIVYLPLSETAEIVCVAMLTTIMVQFLPKREVKEKIIAE